MNRTIAPQIKMPSTIDLAKAKEYVLDNGLKVHYYNGCSEPVLNLTIMNTAGKYYQEKSLAAFYTMNLLKKGTKNYSAKEIEDKIDFYGASLSCESNLFFSNISLSCLSEKLENVLPILKDILTGSIFPEEELVLEKNKQAHKLKINSEKNNYIASVKFSQAIFGENHPCSSLNTIEGIENLKREDLLHHFENKLNFNNETIIILSGEILDQSLQLINNFLGKLPIKENTITEFPVFDSKIEKEIKVEMKNSVQSSIRIGMALANDISEKDRLDLEIVNRIFGGYFGSRLMKNIREDKGYTYGIYSFVSNFVAGSYFGIATDVGVEYRDATINEISKEIIRLKTDLVSDEELQMVKNYHKGRIIKSIDGSMRMANILSLLLPLNENEDYINKQLETVENITAERIKALANKYLDFEKMTKVIVG